MERSDGQRGCLTTAAVPLHVFACVCPLLHVFVSSCASLKKKKKVEKESICQCCGISFCIRVCFEFLDERSALCARGTGRVGRVSLVVVFACVSVCFPSRACSWIPLHEDITPRCFRSLPLSPSVSLSGSVKIP